MSRDSIAITGQTAAAARALAADQAHAAKPAGNMLGNKVAQAGHNNTPPAGNFKARVEHFFATTLPKALTAAKEAVLSLLRPAGNAAAPSAAGASPAQGAASAAGSAAPTAPAAAPAAAAASGPLTIRSAEIFGKGAGTVGASQISFKDVSNDDAKRAAVTYAYVRQQVDVPQNANMSQLLGSFCRGPNLASQSFAFASAEYSSEKAEAIAGYIEGEGPLPVVAKSLGDALNGGTGRSEYGEVEKLLQEGKRGEVAKMVHHAVDLLSLSLENVYGRPGDVFSVAAKAEKVPQELCNLVGVAWQAIDDSALSDDMKGKLKGNIVKDATVLRTVNAKVSDLAAKAGAETLEQRNLLGFNAAIQRLANGLELEPSQQGAFNIYAELGVSDRISGMGKQWGQTIQQFGAAVAARADAGVLASAKADGQRYIDEFEDARTDYNARLQGRKAAGTNGDVGDEVLNSPLTSSPFA